MQMLLKRIKHATDMMYSMAHVSGKTNQPFNELREKKT